MSEVSQGPGWWVASDGRWYPPELHPSRAPSPANPPPAAPPPAALGAPAPATAPGADERFSVGAGAAPRFVVPPVVPDLAPGYGSGAGPAGPVGLPDPGPLAPPPAARPLMHATGLTATASGPTSSPWEIEAPWASGDSERPPVDRAHTESRLRATVDPRGAFVAVTSLLLVAACFLPYYKVSAAGTSGSVTFTVIAHHFGAWRLAILALAGICVLAGIINSTLRVGMSGAVAVLLAMRLLALGQLALWIVALVDKSSKDVIPVLAAPGSFTTKVTWVAFAAVALAVVALSGSLASIGRR